MKDDLIKTIKSGGYWRVNFQPIVLQNIPSLQKCSEIIEKNKVRLRGWDYPHVQIMQNENGGMQPCGNYWESWTDWGASKEFWRMYKSGQFLYYKALREDWYEGDFFYNDLGPLIKPLTSLSVIGSVIFEVTEMFEFLSRLLQEGLYKEGVLVSISLENIKNRILRVDDSRRLPFSYERKTGASKVEYGKVLSADEVINNSKLLANSFIREVFDLFGWNPSEEQILADQEKLLKGLI